MLKDEKGLFTPSEVIGNDKQLTATIKNKDWRFFDLGSKVKVCLVNNEEMYVIRNVITHGKGRQRCVTIPRVNWEWFKKGTTVKIYPMNNEQV